MTKEQIQQIIGTEYEIVVAFKAGSQLYVSNPRDEDMVAVIKDYPAPYKKYRTDNIDLFCYSFDEFYKLATFSSEHSSLYTLNWEFVKEDNNLIICGEFPLKDWNWFNYKKKAIEAALQEGERHYFDEHIFGADAKSCSKSMVWGLLVYYAVINGNLNFTEEQHTIIQKCHDFELPKEEAYVFRQKLLELHKTL